jgi:hypothetical protein
MAEFFALPTAVQSSAALPPASGAPTRRRRPHTGRSVPRAQRALRKQLVDSAGTQIDDVATVLQRMLLAGPELGPEGTSVARMLVSRIQQLNEARTMALDPEWDDLETLQRDIDSCREATRLRTGEFS